MWGSPAEDALPRRRGTSAGKGPARQKVLSRRTPISGLQQFGGRIRNAAPLTSRSIRPVSASADPVRPLSEPHANLLASAVRDRLGATWGIAEFGAAGPSATRYGDPAGCTYLSVVGPVELSRTIEAGSSDRAANMRAFAAAALALLNEALA